MRMRPMMTGAACVLTAGIAAAGCSSSAGSTSEAGIAATSSPAQTSAATGSPATTPAAGSVQPSGSGSSDSTANCQPGSLRIALGSATGGTGQRTQVVDMTNDGPSPCAMDGFPGTDLVGTAVGPDNYSKQDYTWSLSRASQSYSTVTLQPGAVAHFDLIYLPSTSSDIAGGSDDLNVTTILITPPNDFTHAQLSWSQGFLLQDAATHPGSYITPVAAGT